MSTPFVAFSSTHGVVAARDAALLLAVVALLDQEHTPSEADLIDILTWDYELDADENLAASTYAGDAAQPAVA